METKEANVLKKVQEEMRVQHIKKEKQKLVLSQVQDKLEKEKTMSISIKEGSATSVMQGLGESYITPYALALNSSNLQIGFLSSFASLLAPISQVLGSRLMEKYSRKKIIATGVAMQALMWLPILGLSLFFWKNLFVSYLPVILIIFYSLYAILGSIAGPSWFSLLGDIVPEKIRGKYFSRRNKICGTVALLATLTGAFILDYFKTKGLLLIGFSILFVLASIFRLIAAWLFTKHYEPKLHLQDGYYFSIFQFLKKAPDNNFGKFVIFRFFMSFATNIAGPFFGVYMLKTLNFSYINFMLVNISSAVLTLLTLPIWGKLADKYGNRDIMKMGCFLIPLIPIFWLFSTNPFYLILVQGLLAGIGWAGFDLASSNFIYDSVSPERRGICVAYYSVLIGVGAFLGAGLGGFLTQYVELSFISSFFFVFILSGVLRALVPLIFIPRIKEVRKVTKGKTLDYLREFKPVLHLRNILPAQETIDIILYHVKRIKFKRKRQV